MIKYVHGRPESPFLGDVFYRYAYYSFNYKQWYLISGTYEEAVVKLKNMYLLDGIMHLFNEQGVYYWDDCYHNFRRVFNE